MDSNDIILVCSIFVINSIWCRINQIALRRVNGSNAAWNKFNLPFLFRTFLHWFICFLYSKLLLVRHKFKLEFNKVFNAFFKDWRIEKLNEKEINRRNRCNIHIFEHFLLTLCISIHTKRFWPLICDEIYLLLRNRNSFIGNW